jgi:RNA polymerase sigma factor (sigma-70 family)
MTGEHQNEDWKAMWADYGPKLLLFARQQTPTPGDAEDIVQEAFVRYWKARRENRRLLPNLLFTMVKRIATDYARKLESRRNREIAVQALEGPDPFFAPADDQERERREIIESAMRALPEAQREVLTLKLWSGLTFEEIGQCLEISPNTAASRYRYALNQLRESLAPSLI